MSKNRLIITAVTLEGRSQAQLARDYGVSKLMTRYRTEGDTAFETRSRRPHTSPNRTHPDTIRLIIRLRHELANNGHDAGCDTIAWHLEHHHSIRISTSTIHRHLPAAKLVDDQPKKKPRSSYIRFQAEQPNETWQADFTHHRLACGTDIEIFTWLDDHSRFALSVTARQPVTGRVVVTTFRAAINTHGTPFSTVTDNGLVFTARRAHGRKTSRNGLETELARLRFKQKNSRPNHPTTCGKGERFQQTMKRWLNSQTPATTITELQQQLDTFTSYYNHQRPYRSLPNAATPAAAYTTRPKATPNPDHGEPEPRVRYDRINNGRVTLRFNGNMHKIGLGRTLEGTPIVLLINGLDVRVIHPATGEVLRQVTLNPNQRYYGTGKPRGGPQRPYGPRKPDRRHK